MSDAGDNSHEELRSFVAPGMRYTYDLAPIGEMMSRLGDRLIFQPVFGVVGWAERTELIGSVRLRYLNADGLETGHCLIDRDEVQAWLRLLRFNRDAPRVCGSQGLVAMHYSTRHGLTWSWDGGAFFVQIATGQAALLADSSIFEILEILEDFEELCEERL